MVSLGEMIAYLPLPGGQIMLADRFVDSAWAFTLGWNYCEFLKQVFWLSDWDFKRV